ncbi:S-layer homology domain-containing protein [Calidifontibacillus oryziterrae]|uniref:S-layer homology domain-containing protein n=1 Tax=Calidifontibacillus oryziterrae TaxID=1191699 RepID=UPI0002E7700B|nr:S-layer homology domain-containing protein [Calidifontibacillus oryziterrae]
MNLKKVIVSSTLALSLALSASPSGSLAATPADVKGHWAEGDINAMVDKGLIGGYPDGTFKPNAQITRAEFSAILNRSLGFDAQAGSAFSDTKNHWAANDINTLFKNNIIQSKDYGNKYVPNKNITRLEMARMIARSLKETAKDNGASKFKDVGKVSSEDLKHISLNVEKGVIGGYPDQTFKPDQSATRAEASKMLKKMLDVKNGGAKVEVPKPEPKPQPKTESFIPDNLRAEVKNPNPKTAAEVQENLEESTLYNFTGDLKNADHKWADTKDVLLDDKNGRVKGIIRMKLPASDLKIEVDKTLGYNMLVSKTLEEKGFIHGGDLIDDGKIIDPIGYVGGGRYGVGKISDGNIYKADYIAFTRQGSEIHSSLTGPLFYVIMENPFKK